MKNTPEGHSQARLYFQAAVERDLREKAEARTIVQNFDTRAKKGWMSPLSRALVYSGLGEEKRAMDLLDQAYAEKDTFLGRINVDPLYDPIRSEPRFQALLARMNLPKQTTGRSISRLP